MSEFLEFVKREFKRGKVQNKPYRPLVGIGKGGIGKTVAIHKLTEDLGIGYREVRLLLYSEVDLQGIPTIDPKTGMATWSGSAIFPIAERDGDEGILVLDEITSAPINLRTAAYQLLDDKRSLGEYKLPDGWVVVALGNGPEDGGSFQGLEGNLVNRGSRYDVVADIESFKKWANRSGIHTSIIAFLTFNPSALHTYNIDMEEGDAFASPRTWEALSDEIDLNDSLGNTFEADDPIFYRLVAGKVGEDVGREFIAFYGYNKDVINAEDVLAGKVKEMRVTDPQIIHLSIQASIRLFKSHIEMGSHGGNYKGKIMQEAANLCKWIVSLQRLRLDYSTIGVSDLNDACPEIRQIIMSDEFDDVCPEYIEFCQEHNMVYE